MRRSLVSLGIAVIAIGASLYIAGYSHFSSAGDKPVSGATGSGGAISLADIHSDFSSATSSGKVRILIVPGHEPDSGGAHFSTTYERDLVVEIGQDLQQYLQKNPKYQTFITRDTHSWDAVFLNYFTTNWNAIAAWEKTVRIDQARLASLGVSTAPPVDHNAASVDAALRLFGITKWANENNIDVMIHLHLNDYPGHSSKVAGKYSGLVIYAPAQQYANSTTTSRVADAVFKRLSLYNPVNNLPVESGGIIDDPELIAVGTDNTADAASILIEYDYIYEPQFVNPKVRSLALKDLAYQTYLGLQDFFASSNAVSASSSYNPESLYAWDTPVQNKSSNPEDIYAMQTALLMDGDFPPVGKSKNDCPHSGTYGACTQAAITAFQVRNGIVGDGAKTFVLLQKIYDENQTP